jgi:hypothetical protein
MTMALSARRLLLAQVAALLLAACQSTEDRVAARYQQWFAACGYPVGEGRIVSPQEEHALKNCVLALEQTYQTERGHDIQRGIAMMGLGSALIAASPPPPPPPMRTCHTTLHPGGTPGLHHVPLRLSEGTLRNDKADGHPEELALLMTRELQARVALAVDDAGARLGLPAGLGARRQGQHHPDPMPHAVLAEAAEVAVDRAPGRERPRQHPPRAAGAQQVEDGVEDVAQR